MSDKDMISKAFSSLKAPEDTLERIYEKMNKESEKRGVFRHKRLSPVLVVILVLVLGTASVYAAKAFQLGSLFGSGESGESVGQDMEKFTISAPFKGENQFNGFVHDGIDYIAEEGAPVLAAARGKILTAEFDAKKGYYIEIAHEEGYSTLYAHLKEMKVSAGDMVNQGDEIGSVGKTGQATGAHLHFELQKDGQLVDPGEFMAEE